MTFLVFDEDARAAVARTEAVAVRRWRHGSVVEALTLDMLCEALENEWIFTEPGLRMNVPMDGRLKHVLVRAHIKALAAQAPRLTVEHLRLALADEMMGRQ